MIRIAAEAPLFNLPNGSSLSLKATTFLEKMVAPFAQVGTSLAAGYTLPAGAR